MFVFKNPLGWWALVFCVVLALCDAASRQKRIVGGYPALIPETGSEPAVTSRPPPGKSDNVVFMQDDFRSATITGTEEPEGYQAYKGIRYAQPPVGRLRLQRPVLVKLSGEIDATKYGPPCPQPKADGSGMVGSEDCLFLNVFTPLKKLNQTNLPVLIWIHGGGFYSGSGMQYGPVHLVKNNIIVVTINYRLGSLGWLTSHLKELPGNVGLFDIRAAVKWVHAYINNFNGDPERIVISGQGSGASAATLMTMSDFANGMLSGAFTLSGSPISGFAVDSKPKDTYTNMTSILGCDKSESLEAVRCLQELSLQNIISSDSKYKNTKLSNEGFLAGLGGLLSTGPAVEGQNDGRFLPNYLLDSALNLMKKQKMPAIPMLTGVNKLETKTGISGIFQTDVLDKLTKIPDYVNKVLPLNMLDTNTGLFDNSKIKGVLTSLFENNEYLKLVTSSLGEGAKQMQKVMQATTDALFNLPAFFTSTLWSKHSSVYFYSFEHKPKIKSPGKWFLPNNLGNPNKEVSNSNNAEDGGEPSHGDELIFLYDVRTIEGKPIPGVELKDKKDIEMRNNFTALVAEFVRNGKPRLPKLRDEWPSFTSPKQSDYVVLDENSRIENKFRFCEMGLWGGVPDILQSSACNFPGISSILQTVPDILSNSVLGDITGGPANLLGDPLKAIGGLGLLGNSDNNKPPVLGLLGNTDNKPSAPGVLGNNDKKPAGVLGGVLGQKQENKKPNSNAQKPLFGGSSILG